MESIKDGERVVIVSNGAAEAGSLHDFRKPEEVNQLSGSSYDVALVHAGTTAPLAGVLAALRPSGRIIVVGAGDALVGDLVLAGFLEARVCDGYVEAFKPTWDIGAAAPLKLGQRSANGSTATAAAAALTSAAPWKMNVNDLAEDDLIDEDDLLAADEGITFVPASTTAANGASADADGCATKRRACKNCSCGRAEAEAAGESAPVKLSPQDAPTPACGNCYRGDAFRCASCPFLGLPAFDKGKERVVLANLETQVDA